ncbi:hypothetical protein [Variovorax paradoxus]|uniref:hypothetical protein n=1 Tax=Variovorax paradoxus TaxID=34073 RepID=UPI002783085F|nr:hypothetical protein [Variovorax paradoxus]MDP9932869.1 hypothetical protein [Variovorax paradoxus]
MNKRFCLSLAAIACCACASAETFVLPIEEDAGFVVETDWRGHTSLAETRLSTGERSAAFQSQGRVEALDMRQAGDREILEAIFSDAGGRAECQALALLVLCRKTRGLAIKVRSSSEAFVSKTGFLWCIDGLAGRGGCKETAPESSARVRP